MGDFFGWLQKLLQSLFFGQKLGKHLIADELLTLPQQEYILAYSLSHKFLYSCTLS